MSKLIVVAKIVAVLFFVFSFANLFGAAFDVDAGIVNNRVALDQAGIICLVAFGIVAFVFGIGWIHTSNRKNQDNVEMRHTARLARQQTRESVYW